MLSTTEGGDKIVKYAKLFRILDALVVSKTDLLPFTDFDVQAAAEDFARLCPSGEVFPVSARKGEGIDAVVKWISAPALV
ncbi:Hydrogenase maturation factor [Candidatus Hydrogenisulfobacillus filiaventi]|uniref:Hydrogenase maturation factor n=1 Tax=Candidatus Hydrogenisulfobacillus filiaventi TaxID=2707344 RepID=A0A6F8ZF08_9FIRM|nr:Hydrogenase maturation factor [Candidatus Hydrogenisulfobacillus filiaventi]